MKVKFLRTSDKAVMPKKGTPYAAGMDVTAIEKTLIPAKSFAVVPVGLTLAYCEEGYWISILMRSSKRFKQNLLTEGVIDSDYRGDLGVKVFNLGDVDQVIEDGERFAQLVVVPQPEVEIEEGEIEDTERGSGGMGSTGRF